MAGKNQNGKGDKNRVGNFKAYWDSPLWAKKKKAKAKKPKKKLDND